MLFVLAAIKMAVFDWQYAIAALVSLWALLIIAIADKKYMIIPDQFVILLALTAFGYAPYHESFLSPLYGALIGGGCMLIIGITGKLIFKKEALGFGDVKLFAAVGLIAGPYGVSIILIASSFLSCIFFGVELIRGKIKRTDVLALGPFIALSAAAYLVFL
jgi:prepilin signal peptidase PulO-like enzyme (type II secretory pathway)